MKTRRSFSTLHNAILVLTVVTGTAMGSFAQNPPGKRTVPAPTPTPTPVTKPAPAATPTPSPTPTPAPVQTIADLRTRITNRLARPELRRGQIGIKIATLNSEKLVFEENAEKYFMPASNMKNFTVAAGIEKLGPDYRYVTSVFAPAAPDAAGTVKGDLRIYGRGDVSISTSFSEGNYFKGLDDLAAKIAAAGVKRVEGDLVGDDTYFRGGAIPGSWEWDDLQWYYGAEVSALPINDNAVDLTVRPGPAGYGCSVDLSPLNPVFRVVNRCMTTPAGTMRTLKIEKLLGQNVLEITGNLPVGNSGFKGYVTVTRPAELFVSLLRSRLEQKGITITGRTRVIDGSAAACAGCPPPVEIAKLESAPFSLISAKTMKPSQNMYTETILRTLGEEIGRKRTMVTSGNGASPAVEKSSHDLGVAVVENFLTQIGIPDDAVIQHDGSGLSRHDLITPAAVVRLYTYMGRESKYSQAWRDSLTIAGVDGTLRNRLAGTAAAGNVRGKTGTIDQVSALSGYLTTAGGEQLVFSLIVNGVPEGRMRTGVIDDIVLYLVNFNGRIDQ